VPRNQLAVTVLLILLLTGSAFGAATAQAGAEAPFHWSGHLNPEQTLAIRGISGSINIDSIPGDTTEIIARKSGSGAELVDIRVVETQGATFICAMDPRSKGASARSCAGNSEWCKSECNGQGPKVDFIVHLPRSITLSLAMVNGSITGHFSNANWPSQLSIRTVSGDIGLHLPIDVSTRSELQVSSRRLHSEFTMSNPHSLSAGRIISSIGKGGGTLKISTVSGHVVLRKNPPEQSAHRIHVPFAPLFNATELTGNSQ